MTERTVGIGETSSFRYFGVMPPLEDDAIQKIRDELKLPWWVGGFQIIYVTHESRDDCPPHTEFGIDVGDALDWQGRDVVDDGAVQVANSIADILRLNGDIVVVQEEVTTTDFQTPIFGESYNEQREIIQHFSAK